MKINKNFFFALTGSFLTSFVLYFLGMNLGWLEYVVIVILWIPYKIDSRIFSFLGGFAEKDEKIISLISLFQYSKGTAYSMIFNLFQYGEKSATFVFGVSVFQKSKDAIFQGLSINLLTSSKKIGKYWTINIFENYSVYGKDNEYSYVIFSNQQYSRVIYSNEYGKEKILAKQK
jgi:hypothetical protein